MIFFIEVTFFNYRWRQPRVTVTGTSAMFCRVPERRPHRWRHLWSCPVSSHLASSFTNLEKFNFCVLIVNEVLIIERVQIYVLTESDLFQFSNGVWDVIATDKRKVEVLKFKSGLSIKLAKCFTATFVTTHFLCISIPSFH